MEWIMPLMAGLGIGSLLKSIVDHFMSRRASAHDRWYEERREAYLGLLNSIHNAAVRPSDENSKAYALWQTRCDLFGSKEVSKYVQKIIDTNDGPIANRNAAFQGLIGAMKADLHVR